MNYICRCDVFEPSATINGWAQRCIVQDQVRVIQNSFVKFCIRNKQSSIDSLSQIQSFTTDMKGQHCIR